MSEMIYRCEQCQKEAKIESGHAAPECCGQPMKVQDSLPVCEMATSPEHARMDGGDPCDDGRAG